MSKFPAEQNQVVTGLPLADMTGQMPEINAQGQRVRCAIGNAAARAMQQRGGIHAPLRVTDYSVHNRE